MQYKMIDLHCHILPDMDDGVQSEEEMEAVLKSAWKQGIYAMLATSHFPAKKGRDAKIRQEKLLLAQKVAQEISPEFRIYMGNEIFWMDGIVEALQYGEAMPLAESRYVLVEFFPEAEYKQLYRAANELTQAGYIPVLAHIERYLCLVREWERLDKLEDAGCYFQVNMASLLGSWWNSSVRYCRKLVQEGWVHFMGTDTHGMNFRPIEIEKSYEWIYQNCTKEYADRILYQNAEAVIANKILQD